MKKKYLSYHKDISSGGNIIFLFICCLIITIVILPEAEAMLQVYTNQAGVIKNKTFYQPKIFYQAIAIWGEEGRRYYIFLLLTVNLSFAFLYNLGLTLSFFWLKEKLSFSIQKTFFLLPTLLFTIIAFKNLLLVFILTSFPACYPLLVRFLGLLFLLQMILLCLIMGILLALVFFWWKGYFASILKTIRMTK